MVKIEGRYLGDLRCEASHGDSGATLKTDAPKDNMGLGASFSPTDLVATAFGTCVVTTIAIVARRRGFDVAAMTFSVEKHMATDPVRRIGRLPLTVHLPAGLDAAQRDICERAAAACPVHKSLHPDIEATITFAYA
ncbi:MAG: OsmC family protein [Planctomycetes bacterium]|nr:OsmC family protein [Planctomycetota bacterium]